MENSIQERIDDCIKEMCRSFIESLRIDKFVNFESYYKAISDKSLIRYQFSLFVDSFENGETPEILKIAKDNVILSDCFKHDLKS